MRFKYQHAYCRAAIYRYNYDKTIKPPDSKDVMRLPYQNAADKKTAIRRMIRKTYDSMYEYMHIGMFDPMLLKLSTYTTDSRSYITYRGFPLFQMIVGVVYQFDSNNYRYHCYSIEVDIKKGEVYVFIPNSDKIIAVIAINDRYSSEYLEDAYQYIDGYILSGKQIGNAIQSGIELPYEDQMMIPEFKGKKKEDK